MLFTSSEKNSIMEDFPNIKLSYENLLHKKVYNTDLYLAIPQGKKCCLWFREFNNNPVCLFVEMNKNTNFHDRDIRLLNCCFNFELTYGTIIYGTYFQYNGSKFFTVEDIFYYKGEFVSNNTWKDKFNIFSLLLDNDIKNVTYNNHFITIGLPLITINEINMKNELERIPYKIKNIQLRNLHKKNVSDFIPYYTFLDNKEMVEKTNFTLNKVEKIIKNDNIVPYSTSYINTNSNSSLYKNSTKKEVIFKIKPDIQNDIYHLYYMDKNNKLTYYDVSFIPDFVTSVMMNKLFRNIKENNNLDYLEESDDEEEFENDNQDKFVYLDREYNMVCRYNYKFKKWYPISVTNDNRQISTYDDISYFTKIIKRY